MTWPLALIATGIGLGYASTPLIRRVTSSWRARQPHTEDERLAFVRSTPLVWLMPPISFLSLGLVAAGLVWLAVELVT